MPVFTRVFQDLQFLSLKPNFEDFRKWPENRGPEEAPFLVSFYSFLDSLTLGLEPLSLSGSIHKVT